MGKSWLTALLIVLLVVVALGWWNTSRSRMELAKRLRETQQKVQQQTTPTPTTPAKPAQQTDPAPNGCGDCHKKVAPDKDYTLAAEAARVKGHPKVTATTVKECMVCHAERVKPFKQVLHTAHLKGKVYTQKYDTSCIACHKMRDDGSIGVKGYNI